MICTQTFSFKTIAKDGNMIDEFILQRKSGNHGTLFNRNHMLMDTDFYQCVKEYERLLEMSKDMASMGFIGNVIEE